MHIGDCRNSQTGQEHCTQPKGVQPEYCAQTLLVLVRFTYCGNANHFKYSEYICFCFRLGIIFPILVDDPLCVCVEYETLIQLQMSNSQEGLLREVTLLSSFFTPFPAHHCLPHSYRLL